MNKLIHGQQRPMGTGCDSAASRSINSCTYRTGFFGGKFFPFHRGHLDCILRCASECEKLYVVLLHHGDQENEILANYTGRFPIESLDAHVRELALRAELRPFENIEVISYDCRPADARATAEGKHPWHYECEDMVRLMGRFDVAYSSEPEYAETFRMFYPWADAVVLDAQRARNPITATRIRNMPFYQAYDLLPRAYQKLINKKVLVTGTESCGKSALVRKLAAMFGTSYTEEAGRLVCEQLGLVSPGAELYPSILFAQKAADQRAIETARMVAICDTDAIVTDYYLRLYEHQTLPAAMEIAKLNQWDLVLFVEPTVPWVDDGLRISSDQDEREALSRSLRETYLELGYQLVVLDGNYRQNYERALDEVGKLLGYGGEGE